MEVKKQEILKQIVSTDATLQDFEQAHLEYCVQF